MPRHRSRARLLCLALTWPWLGACIHYAPQPLDPAAQASQLAGRRLSAKTWTLPALIDEATRANPDLALARAKYQTALAAVRTAGERPNPTVSLLPQIGNPLITGTYSIDFDWTIETAGKRSKRQLVAEAQVRAAKAEIIQAGWKVRSAVRKALVDMYVAEQRIHWLNEAIHRQDELLKAFEEQVKAGAESRSIMAQARLLQAQMRLQAADNAKQSAAARASLAEALTMGVSGLDRAQFSFANFERDTSPSIPGRKAVLTHRADIYSSLADYEAAEATLRLEIAKQYPDIHFDPGYQLNAGENQWNVGVGLTLPILNHNQGAIGEAEAKRKEAAVSFDAVQAKALVEYEKAVSSLSAAKTKLKSVDALIAELKLQTASEERLLNAGSGDKTSLLSAKVEEAVAQVSRVEAMGDLHTALGSLEEAAQTPIAD